MKLKLAFFSVGLSVSLLNCTQDELIGTNSEDSKPSSQRVAAVPASKTVTFANYTTANFNTAYSYSNGLSDFGGLKGTSAEWDRYDNAKIGYQLLRVTLPPYVHSDTPLYEPHATDKSGFNFNVPIETANQVVEYEVSFNVKFDNGFEFSRGGKIGLGITIGKGNSGGNTPPDDGGSLRFMWKAPKGGYLADANGNRSMVTGTNAAAYFVPYAYYSEQPNQYGDEFGKKTTFALETERWYTLYMRVKANTNTSITSPNGAIEMRVAQDEKAVATRTDIDKLPVLYQDNTFQWTHTPVKITNLSFNVFRGGNDDNWVGTQTGRMYFKNIRWKKL